jgi:hypothetical protein
MALITNQGEEQVVDSLLADTIWTHIGWGTSSTAEAETQTDLVAAAAEARVAASLSKVGTGDSAVYRATGTITSLSGQTIREVGLFTASTAANLGMRHVHADTALLTGESIAYTIDVNPE